MKKLYHTALLIVALILLSCNKKNVEVQDPNILATGFTIPWAIEVIGEEEFLVTERLGQLYHYQDGALTALPNMPSVQTVSDGYLTYGGLMDVSLHPQFESNRWVYITYVGLDWVMRVGRFALLDNTVKNFKVIFESDAFSIGSRIAWQDDEHFFVSQGSGGNPYPEPGGQDLNSDVGKSTDSQPKVISQQIIQSSKGIRKRVVPGVMATGIRRAYTTMSQQASYILTNMVHWEEMS